METFLWVIVAAGVMGLVVATLYLRSKKACKPVSRWAYMSSLFAAMGILLISTDMVLGLSLVVVGAVLAAIDIFGKNKKNNLIGANQERLEQKEENKAKILSFDFAQDKITNDQVQKLLGISDATAERYLDELEKEGKIKQVGEKGGHIYYEVTK